MATLLYVFPHPDDECFGPSPGIAQQLRTGHDVHLLTLTRGEATSQRERLGFTKEEMAETRYDEMQDVAETLGLTSMTVLECPDGQLAELNPLVLENEVAGQIHETEPDVVITYPVHGISAHPDHLVSHAVVKRVACGLWRDGAAYPRRLAFFTLPPAPEGADRPEHLQHSPAELIDCAYTVSQTDLKKGREALYCYKTYLPVIEKHKPLESGGDQMAFELFAERHDPRLASLLEDLPERAEQLPTDA